MLIQRIATIEMDSTWPGRLPNNGGRGHINLARSCTIYYFKEKAY